MFRAIFFVFGLTFTVFSGVNTEKNCDTLGILIYDDLGCKIAKKNEEGCPIKYECDDFSGKNDSCLFRGKTYALNQQIDNDITYPSCQVGCFCENSLGKTKFTCAVLDCPEWLGVPVKPGCYRKFKVDACCSVGMTCPSEGKSLTECNIDGKKYIAGEKFFPQNSCSKCVCDEDWNENLKEPSCKRFLCNTQINYAEELNNRCAPCYFKSSGETLCCPDTWVCPSSADEISKVNSDVESNSELTCAFGTKTLNLGEGFRTKVDRFGSDKDVQCECAVPPLLTCKEV